MPRKPKDWWSLQAPFCWNRWLVGLWQWRFRWWRKARMLNRIIKSGISVQLQQDDDDEIIQFKFQMKSVINFFKDFFLQALIVFLWIIICINIFFSELIMSFSVVLFHLETLFLSNMDAMFLKYGWMNALPILKLVFFKFDGKVRYLINISYYYLINSSLQYFEKII